MNATNSISSKLLNAIQDRISFIFVGLGICLVLATTGFLLGTVAAFLIASAAWGTFLSFWRVAICYTLGWLVAICIALSVIGGGLDGIRWYDIIFVAFGCVVLFLIGWGAGIRLYINHVGRKSE
jgi:hypothetical protein